MKRMGNLKKIKKRLKFLYDKKGEETFEKLKKILEKYKNNKVIKRKRVEFLKNKKRFFSEKDSVLITYGDSLIKKGEKPLASLYNFLRKKINNKITCVHVLPFFKHDSEDNFSIIEHKKIDGKLGNLKDIQRIGRKYRLMVDLVINHVSVNSKWFQKFLKGDKKYIDYFISFEKKINTGYVFRPRVNPLLTKFKTSLGVRYVWTTFSEDLPDLNFRNPDVLLDMIDILFFYLSNYVEIIRLDAIGYLWKEKNTSCFNLPQTHEIVKLLREAVEEIAPYVVIIAEVNASYRKYVSYLKKNEVHLVYQFALPPLVIDSFLRKDTTNLKKLFNETKKVPNIFLNFLASHDGIALRGEGFLSKSEVAKIVKTCKKNNGYISYRSAKNKKEIYEMNISFFDILAEPNLKFNLKIKKFIASQSVMIFCKGVPGIYIHSLLGSRNWNKGVKKALKKFKKRNLNEAYRKINREKLNLEKIEKELKKNSLRKKIFENYLKLLKVRSENKEFNPYFPEKILKSDKRLLVLKKGKLIVIINFSDEEIEIKKYKEKKELISGRKFNSRVEGYGVYVLK